MKKGRKYRKAQYEIHPLFLDRWSPRAMSGEKITKKELMSLFEAARWAPSSFNNQPWRFIYAQRGTKHWKPIFNLLVEGNQSWCKNAAVLMVLISRDTFEYKNKPARTHSFDTGSAWENFALQGAKQGLVVHAMEGFDYDKAKKVLKIPKGYTVECMIAVGKSGNVKDLPERAQKIESPNTRKKVSEFTFEGVFKK